MDLKIEIEVPGCVFNVEKNSPNCNGAKIIRKLRELCRWRLDSFPGSQPISLTRLNLETLGRSPFVACEKTDGVRYLLFAVSEKVFLIDRLETIRCLDMHLPCPYALQKNHHMTVLDGELVTDIIFSEKEPNKKLVRFLIYDAMRINNQSVMELNLLDRLSIIYTDVILPRLEYVKMYPEKIEEEKENNSFLDIYLKDFFEIWDIDTILKFSTKLPHASDGIIFTSVFLPYTPGACSGLLKWKPPHLNTVDFFVDIVTESYGQAEKKYSRKPLGARLFAGRKGFKVFTGKWVSLCKGKCQQLFEMFENGDDSVNMTIWECYYDFDAIAIIPSVVYNHDNSETFDFTNIKEEKGSWCVERIRIDKTTPNDEHVVNRVFESICDGVTFEELQQTFQKYRDAGKPSVLSFCENSRTHKNLTEEQRFESSVTAVP